MGINGQSGQGHHRCAYHQGRDSPGNSLYVFSSFFFIFLVCVKSLCKCSVCFMWGRGKLFYQCLPCRRCDYFSGHVSGCSAGGLGLTLGPNIGVDPLPETLHQELAVSGEGSRALQRRRCSIRPGAGFDCKGADIPPPPP